MAFITSRSKSVYHIRSVSLPACPHPSNLQVDEQLSRLRSSESASSSLSSIGNKLCILEEMFDSFNDILESSHTQQGFLKSNKSVEDTLDGLMRLLDLCSNVKDISLLTKQDVQELLSVLRRRRETNEIKKYLTSRKMAKKGIQKSLKELKNIKLNYKNIEIDSISSLFIATEEATLEVFESMMSYIAGSKSQSKFSELVAKKFFPKNASVKGEILNTNEFEKVDDEVDSLINKKAETKVDNLQSQLTTMESNLQGLEQGLESLFRRLIKTRVSILNLLNN